MNFWYEMQKEMQKELPKYYSFLLEDNRRLMNTALALSREDHEERIHSCKEQINNYQYAAGGELLHRGYRCPSLIKDIVIGNCNRGRILVHPTKAKQKIEYEYGLHDNQLLLVKHYLSDQAFEIEYVSYSGDIQIGYTFDSEMLLQTISECIYHSDKLMSYSVVNLNSCGVFISSEKEIYEYDNDLLYSTTSYMMQTLNSCTHNKYIFNHNSDGFLVSYQVIEYENGSEKENYYWKDHLFKITKKRKV